MKLQNKLTGIIALSSFLVLGTLSFLYSEWNYESGVKRQYTQLLLDAQDSAKQIGDKLIEKIDTTNTLASAPIIEEFLESSNSEYKKFNTIDREKKIDRLNELWEKAPSANDPFVKPYLNNQLAKFLKKQLKILPNQYGEIFITNRYGALVASTGKLSTLAHAKKYWWKASFDGSKGKIFIDDRGFDRSVNGYVVGVVVPIRKNGKVIGILKSNINIIGTLSQITKMYDNNNNGKLKITRTKGLIVYENGFPPLSTTVNSLLLKNLKEHKIGSELVNYDDKNQFVGYCPIKLTINDALVGFGGKKSSMDHSKGNEKEIWHTVISYDKKDALQNVHQTNMLIIYLSSFFILLISLFSYIVGKKISRPIEELSLSRDKLFQEVQRREVAETELIKKDNLMIAQSRHAAMGEMISMIAHQWRQPISVIAMGANNILADIELNILEPKALKMASLDIVEQTQELSKTIDDFRDFFKPSKEIEEILPKDLFLEAFKIVSASFKNSDIELKIEVENHTKIKTYSRELMQVFLNILKNSKEALLDNSVEIKYVNVFIKDDLNNVSIRICDNAKGIKDELLQTIFDPYFSTKNEKNGTGLGLYISKIIIEQHLQGSITAYNKDDGACFEMKLPSTMKE